MIEFWRGKNLLVSFFIKVLHREYNPLILLRITPQRNAALFSFLSFLKDFKSHFVSSALIVIVQAFHNFRKVDTESAKFTLSSSNSCSGEKLIFATRVLARKKLHSFPIPFQWCVISYNLRFTLCILFCRGSWIFFL